MPLSQQIKTLINEAWTDGVPCLVATIGPEGPNLAPKGSMIAFDDEHLAWWERSKKGALANLQYDKRVCIMYANMKLQNEGVMNASFLRFFGTVELIESGPIHQKAFSMLKPREQTHEGADTGLCALVKITKAIDNRGKDLMAG